MRTFKNPVSTTDSAGDLGTPQPGDRLPPVVRAIGFWVTAAPMALAFLFAIGEAVSDPGGLEAVGYVLAMLVPLAALVALAVWRQELGNRVLLAALLVPIGFAAWGLVDLQGLKDFQDQVGPVFPILLMTIGTALAFLGRHWPHTFTAGWAMVTLAVLPAAIVAIAYSGIQLFAVFAAVPILITGVLYLWAGTLRDR